MTGEEPLLRVGGLRAGHGKEPTLTVDSLALNAGETLAIIGPNGAGKSTLLMCLAGLLAPRAGEITFRGQSVQGGDAGLSYRRRIAVVFQEPTLLNATVFENVATGPKLRGTPKNLIHGLVEENLGRFGVAGLRERSARSLSGGEAQRVALARAFAVNPEIVFLDEPFSALDPPTREALLADLGSNLQKTRTSAVFVTHDRMEALYLADRLAVMKNGTIVQTGVPDEVMNHPADEFVASFVGMETLVTGVAAQSHDGLVTLKVGGVELEASGEAATGREVTVGIRPENVTILAREPDDKTSARNNFSAKIVRVSALGHFHRVVLDCGFPLTALVTARSARELGLSAGQGVTASVKATAIHLIPRRAGKKE